MCRVCLCVPVVIMTPEGFNWRVQIVGLVTPHKSRPPLASGSHVNKHHPCALSREFNSGSLSACCFCPNDGLLPCLCLFSPLLKQQNTEESLGPSLHYFKKPIIRHQSIYVIRKSLPLQSWLSSLHTVITGTKSIFNHFTDWAHQLSRNIVSCLLCESNIWAKTITLLCSQTIQSRAFYSTRRLPPSPYVALSFPFCLSLFFLLILFLPLMGAWWITFKAL